MESQDTVYLLKECDAGSKMAVTSIDEVLDQVRDSRMKEILSESKAHHEKLGNEIHSQLIRHQSEEKEPSVMAKSMSHMKTNMKLGMNNCDATVADLITDGCNMGIKSLYKYMNQYQAADHAARDLCIRLADIEEQLRKDMQGYL